MKQLARYSALAIVLGLSACLGKCSDKKGDQGSTGPGSSGEGAASGGSLILAAQSQGAFLPPELADAKYADESTLPLDVFKLPPGDFSAAVTEAEPNNTALTASPLGPQAPARGSLSTGDYDFFVFETTGEPQLWAIEVAGRSVGDLSYVTPSNDISARSQRMDSLTLVIPNLYLAEGRHSIFLRPSGSPPGAYTLRAIPLGNPDLRLEREPNDSEPLAQMLRPGIARAGFLLDRPDRDFYSFSVREPSHILLQATSPPDLTLMVTVSQWAGSSYSFNATSPGQNARMDVMLPPGDYVAIVQSNDKGSLTPYKIRLDMLDPFALPPDREPNNVPAEAAPLPADLVLKGSVGEYGDRDWYKLPTVPTETSMRVQVVSLGKAMNPRGSISVVNRAGDRDSSLPWAGTDSLLEVKLPANVPLFMQLSNRGEYELKLSFAPAIPAIPGKATFKVSLPPGPHLIEAFSTRGQRQSLPVTVHNSGSQPIQVALEAVVNHSSWTMSPDRQTVTVEAGKDLQVPLTLNLPPDAASGDAVQVAIRGTSASGSASATTSVYPLCAATPVDAHVYSPLPEKMLGGLNLASASLGGHPVTSDLKLGREKMLYDGITPSDAAWTGDRTSADPDVNLTVALAGDHAATITGIALMPGNGGRNEQVDEFDVLVSDDGQAFRQVMSGRLRAAAIEQGFAFPQPVSARFARLHVRSNHSAQANSRSTLGEWKVIGTPGVPLLATATFNLADPILGGHIVWSRPLHPWPSEAILSDGKGPGPIKLNPANVNEWVVGFRHNRAAQISRLEWVQPAVVEYKTRTLSKVEVSVSTDSPTGPWIPLGSWKMNPAVKSVTPLNLSAPVWARYVRFSTTEPQKKDEYWRLAQAIRIYERAIDANYKSAVAEWGHYSRPAVYERMVAAPGSVNPDEVTGNGKREDAKRLESGKNYRGKVILEEDEDWYRIDVPKDHNKLSVDLQGDPMLRAIATLQDESGKLLSASVSPGAGGTTRVEAAVEGGKTYFLRLAEPPRSILLVWDNSGSISNYLTAMYRSMARMVGTVQPRREFLNLLPFRDDPKNKFLLATWSDQPNILRAGIQNYNRADRSSDSEFNLLAATEELAKREGTKAILLITDALSPGYLRTSELWAAFTRVPVRVFAIQLQIGNDAVRQQRLMEDWASAHDGHYTAFKTGEDLEVAFDRVSCYLRRPARYTMTADSRFEQPPAPGGIANTLAKSGRVDVYGIYFDVGSATLKAESGPVLKEISDALVKNPAWKLSVEGHTDNAGADASNMVLSRNRAASVKEALVSRFGISGTRLATAGFGASRPKESNGTLKGRARNRRVELIRQ